MKRPIAILALGCVLVVIGIASGWFAASQGQSTAAEEDAHAGEAESLSPQALKNLGVTVGPAETSTFVRHASVQAMVMDAPLNTRPVVAPLGGIVTAIHMEPGHVAAPGELLVSIARSPIPRPALALTADILTPVSENLHEAVSQLRTAVGQHAIAKMELERVQQFGRTEDGLPVVPTQKLIDLEYDLKRAEQARHNAERELERHGLSRDEIETVTAGGNPPSGQRLWKRALQQNALWGETEESILETLPDKDRTHPWSIAAIGELSAAGLATPALAAALRAKPHMTTHFVQVASLLLDGNSVEKCLLLAEAGALEPVMALKAPAGAHDWDVAELAVRPGERVEAGDTVALLHDPRTMWLRLEPVGDEIADVARALETGAALKARPLVPGSGPALEGLKVSRLETRADAAERGAVAYVICSNEPVGGGDGARSWRLRVGLRYLVSVPVETLEGRFVLPAGAVTDQGAEKVVFLRDGKTFLAKPVHVEYEDDEIVVIANDGAIFDGDEVVKTGAFALGLAMQAGSGAVDPHAGHNHG
jgi:biotin carboxyl carrier protein